MRISFAPGIACLFLLFAAAPLTAMAVPVCPSGALCIDESIEGHPPTVTSDSPLFISATVFLEPPPFFNGPESWGILVKMRGAFIGGDTFGSPFTFKLLEPGTGTVSDIFTVAGRGPDPLDPNITNFAYRLSSDDESGNIVNIDIGFCPTISCGTAVEDGTFQLAQTGAATADGMWDVYLKSDTEAVPEPSTGLLLALGLITLAMRLRCRNRKRPARHSAITEVSRSSASSQAAPS